MRKVWVLLFWPLLALAQEWVLIGHPGSALHTMDAATVRAVYLGKQRYIGDIRVIPLQLNAEDPLRLRFESDVLKLSRSALREWWIRRHYLGQRPPRVVGSPEAVVAYVLKVDGAIGYVPETMAEDANVTILFSMPEVQP